MNQAVGGLLGGNKFFPEGIVENHLLNKVRIALRGRGYLLGIHREPKSKGGAISVLAPGVDASTVVVNNKRAGHQVNPVFGRGVAANNKWVKDQSKGFLGQAGAVVTDLDLDFGFVRTRAI